MQRVYLFFIFICAGAVAPAQSFDSKWLMGGHPNRNWFNIFIKINKSICAFP